MLEHTRKEQFGDEHPTQRRSVFLGLRRGTRSSCRQSACGTSGEPAVNGDGEQYYFSAKNKLVAST